MTDAIVEKALAQINANICLKDSEKIHKKLPSNVVDAFSKYFPSAKCRPNLAMSAYQSLKEGLKDKFGKTEEVIATLTPFLTIPNLGCFGYEDIIEVLRGGQELDIINDCKLSDLNRIKGIIILVLGTNNKNLTLSSVSQIAERYSTNLEENIPSVFVVGEFNKDCKGIYDREYVDAVVVR